MVGSLVDAGLSLLGNSQQNDYNMELAKYQNDYNTKLWHMQNEYNSPKATMLRLTEAGINPRAYQQIGQFANAEAPQPAANMQKVSELSAFQSVVRQSLENDLLRNEVKKTQSESNYKDALTRMSKVQLTSEQHNQMKDAMMFTIYLAENGILFENPYLNGSGNTYLDMKMTDQPALKIMAASFDSMYKTKLNLNTWLSKMRQYEALSKEEQYRLLDQYGLDPKHDPYGIVTILSTVLRLIEKAQGYKLE